MEEQMTFIHTNYHGKTDTFRVVDSIEEVPLGYIIWNIGRHNFPLQSYIPMARQASETTIDPNTLMAVPVGSEQRAIYLMDLAHRKRFDCSDIKAGRV